jgi:hypothetical protein
LHWGTILNSIVFRVLEDSKIYLIR